MIKLKLEKPSIVKEAEKAKFLPNIWLKLLVFIAVFFIGQMISSIPLLVLMFIGMIKDFASNGGSYSVELNPDNIMSFIPNSEITMLFSTALATIVTILFCRFIEKRSIQSMGFVKKNAIKDYLIGLVVGFSLFGLAILICVATGTLNYEGFTLGSGLPIIFIFLLGFIIQGMSEEVILRGYLLVTLSAKGKMIIGIIINSVLFALMHLANSGITLLSVINIALFGVFASIYMLKRDSIWGVCAIHTIWNFAQGNIFGIKVSGMNMQQSVFSFVPTQTGNLINGGSFGLEGGLAVTIVLILGIIMTLFMKQMKTIEN